VRRRINHEFDIDRAMVFKQRFARNGAHAGLQCRGDAAHEEAPVVAAKGKRLSRPDLGPGRH
jgi:hypothetical protein